MFIQPVLKSRSSDVVLPRTVLLCTLRCEEFVPKTFRMPAVETAIREIEMRTAARHRILQRCFVHPAKASGPEAWHCIAYNISATGIGVTLPMNLPEGTLCSVQAWGL